MTASSPALRRLRWWDIATIAPLEQALFPDDPWSLETFWSELAQGPTRHYVVAVTTEHDEEAERIVGYAGIALGSGDADVQTLAVTPEQQGRGVGRLLLAELLAHAWRRRCSAVLLEVRADNDPARRLYERAGFVQIGVRRGYYRPGPVDALVLRLRRVDPVIA